MNKYYKISIIVLAGILAYFVLTNLYAQQNFSEMKLKYDSFEQVQSFKETYPLQGMSTSGNILGMDTISYTYTKGNVFVELMIYPTNNDYVELNCYDISDHDNFAKFYSVDFPSVEDISSSVSYCGLN